MTLRISTALVALALAASCGDDADRSDFFADGGLEPDDGSDAGDSGADGPKGDSGGDEDGGTGDDPKFDVADGADDTAGDDVTEGCKGIDFLFVVDNSGSMADEQIALVTSFPGFVDAIEATLEDKAKDFHVMVVDTDDGFGFDPDAEPGTCEAEIGAGLRTDTQYFECGLPDGQRYLTNADPNLPGAFACLAYVGTYGDPNERPMKALGQAVGELAQPDGCNEGFVRDDALLVVTVITDEEDSDSPGSPVQWLDPVLSAKQGNLENVVMLGLISDRGLPNAVCQNGNAQNAPLLNQFVEQFGPNGLRGSVCADEYPPFFEQAVDIIEQACSDFMPPG